MRKPARITRLHNKATGREWASEQNPIALLTYQTLSQEDYTRYRASYVIYQRGLGAERLWQAEYRALWRETRRVAAGRHWCQVEERDDAHRIKSPSSLQFDDARLPNLAGPHFRGIAFVDLLLPNAEPVIHLQSSWFGKPATRMPEALWLTFNPIAEDVKGWKLEKSGEWISPFDVVASGNRHMHAVQKGIRRNAGGHAFAVDTLDAPVVALGERDPILFSNDQPDLTKGLHSCLFNNCWGTNYIMWYGEDLRARYVIHA